MLPRLSHLSVSTVPGIRLRLRCSAGYQRISPLHPAFRFPLPNSSHAVSDALSNAGYSFISAEQSKIPANYVELTDEDAIKNMEKLLDMLDDNDDVTNVWHNWEEA